METYVRTLMFMVAAVLLFHAPMEAQSLVANEVGNVHELAFFNDVASPIRALPQDGGRTIAMLRAHTILRVPENPDMRGAFVLVKTLAGTQGWIEASHLEVVRSFAKRGWVSDSSTWQAWRSGPFCMEDSIPAGKHESCAVVESPSYRHFADGKDWILRDPLVYEVGVSGQRVTVPVGFVTDFASVPRALRSIASLRSLYSDAAVLHDFLYWTQPCTKPEADNLFLIAMRETGVSAWEARAFYLAVRFAGRAAWDGNATERANHAIRIIPPQYQLPPPLATWESYRTELARQGVVQDAPYLAVQPPVCQLGDSDEVPKQRWKLASGLK